MSTNDNNTNKDKDKDNKGNRTSVAEMLAKKTPAESPTATLTDMVAGEPAFRVFNHRYEFKFNDRILKPDEKNIYTPSNSEEFEFLRLQVSRGNIHFN